VNYISRFHSGFDLGYANALTWRTPADLIEQLMGLTPERLALQSRAARTHYEHHHSPELLAPLLGLGDGANAGTAPKPIPLRDYQPDALQVFLDERLLHDAQLAAHRKDAIQIASLKQSVIELASKLTESESTLTAVLRSNSWRITLLLREARLWVDARKVQSKRYAKAALRRLKRTY
jgi:DNA-binding transcriptional ArsR family regulator